MGDNAIYSLWKRRLPKPLKTAAMVFWYNVVSRLDTGDDLLFLNHGFAPVEGDVRTIELAAGDEKDRFAIQLYHQLAVRADWQGKDALEVSCGHGGGIAWLMRYLKPGSLVGLDIAKVSIADCRNRYSLPRLSFETGDAQAMPFEDERFDIVFNVESSLNYPDFNAFVKEAFRVLKPGGVLLICDYRRKNKALREKTRLMDAGFLVTSWQDISPQIVRGLELSEGRKLEVIEKYAPHLLHNIIRRFAGVAPGRDSERELFASGHKEYFSAALQKPAAAPSAA